MPLQLWLLWAAFKICHGKNISFSGVVRDKYQVCQRGGGNILRAKQRGYITKERGEEGEGEKRRKGERDCVHL